MIEFDIVNFGSTETSQLAQLAEHRSYEPKVTGSDPVLRTFFLYYTSYINNKTT